VKERIRVAWDQHCAVSYLDAALSSVLYVCMPRVYRWDVLALRLVLGSG